MNRRPDGHCCGKEVNILPERYTIKATLSEHAYSTVWLAEQTKLAAQRTIKGIRKGTDHHNALLSEAGLLSDLNHPGIPRILDVTEDEEYTYIIEEYVPGESLGALLKHRLLSENELLSVLFGIGEILDYLHSQKKPIVHMDLKPENVILTDKGEVYLIDFGSAGYAEEKKHALFSNRGFYPEEADGGARMHPSSDIFALGRLTEYLTKRSTAAPGTSKRLIKTARACCRGNNRVRIASAGIYVKMIASLREKETQSSVRRRTDADQTARTVRIGVFGLSRGVGTTTVAVALSNYLGGERNMRTVCREENESGDIAALAERIGKKEYNGVTYCPSGVRALPEGNCTYAVYDLGCEIRSALPILMECDIRLLVGSGAPWRRDIPGTVAKIKDRLHGDKGLCLLISRGGGKDMERMRGVGVPVYTVPMIPDVFEPEGEVTKVFEGVLRSSHSIFRLFRA